MIKLLGSVFVMSAAVLWLYYPIFLKQRRLHVLFEMLSLLRYASYELRTNMLSLNELLLQLRLKSTVTMPFWETIITEIAENGIAYIHEIWQRNLTEYKSILQWMEYSSLSDLGAILGQYMLDDQIKAIDECILILDDGYQNTKSEMKQFTRFQFGIGMSVGLMIVIVLL